MTDKQQNLTIALLLVIPKSASRRRLLDNLTTFNANRADGFWVKRATIAQADVLVMKAAAVSMEVSHHQSKVIYQEYLPPHGVETPDEDKAGTDDGDEARTSEGDDNEEQDDAEAEVDEEEEGKDNDEVEDEDEPEVENDDEEIYLSDREMSNLQTNITETQHPECTIGRLCNDDHRVYTVAC